MFHLYKKSYLEYDFLYTEVYPHLLASNNWLSESILSNEDKALLEASTLSFDEILETEFGNDLEQLWTYLYTPEINDRRRFVLYVNKDKYNFLQIQYWKSCFENASLESCYFLHKMYIQDLKLKSLFSNQLHPKVRERVENELMPLSEEDFQILYDQIEPSPFLSELDTCDRSFEYLLASFFYDQNSFWKDDFLERLKLYSGKLVLGELEILKGEVIRGAFDFVQSFSNELAIDQVSDYIENFDQILLSRKELSWMNDKDLLNYSVEHLIDTYPKETFTDLIASQYQKSIETKIDQSLIDNDEIIKIFDFVYDQDYLGLLNFDIQKGFGSLFFNNDQRYKVNSLFVSYLYELHRLGKKDSLEAFIVR